MSNVIAAFGPFRVIDGEGGDVIFVDYVNATAHVLDKEAFADFAAEVLDALDPVPVVKADEPCGVTADYAPGCTFVDEVVSPDVALMREAFRSMMDGPQHPSTAKFFRFGAPDYVSTPWGLYAVAA